MGSAAPRQRSGKKTLGSVLDHVDADAKDLQKQLGDYAKKRLDEYFTALRQLEKSVTAKTPGCSVPSKAPGASLPYAERVKAFHELIKLAFQCDQTRVLSFMIEFGLSGRSHDFLGAPGTHHGLSHYGNSSGRDRLEKIERWHSEQLAGLLQLLASTKDANGKVLLDDTLVLVMPSMGEGRNHDHQRNCPLLVGGKSIVKTNGNRLAFGGSERLTNLHVSLLAAFGIKGKFGPTGATFGDDGNKVIPGIVA